MNDASSGDDYESSFQPLKSSEKYFVIAISIVLTALINWFCQSLWNLGILFCVLPKFVITKLYLMYLNKSTALPF